jgi:hypothetical protein
MQTAHAGESSYTAMPEYVRLELRIYEEGARRDAVSDIDKEGSTQLLRRRKLPICS